MSHSPGIRRRSTLLRLLATTLAWAGLGRAAAQQHAQAQRPAEEERLSTAVFRAGLDKRGLTDLLALHVTDFPSANPIDGLLMLRDIRLAEAADPSRSRDERAKRIAEANDLLERLIVNYPHDLRRFRWRYDLAHSLIYREADPHLTNLLFREGLAPEPAGLSAVTARAVETLTALLDELAGEFARIDLLPVPEFERLEAAGHVERVDRLEPKARYLLLWARFYDAIARDQADPIRIEHLTSLARTLTPDSTLLDTPHASSHVQVQSFLLAGMTQRRLGDHRRAGQFLDSAIQRAAPIHDPQERASIEWAESLAAVERIRNELDRERFDDAQRYLQALTVDVASRGPGRRLVGALLERSLRRQLADAAGHDARAEQARQYAESAWHPLADLAASEPGYREEVYATLYGAIKPDADVGRLDPLEQCALVAGLLGDDESGTKQLPKRVERAIEVAEAFLTESEQPARRGDSRIRGLVPEVLYNLAVALYRAGDRPAAARRFVEITDRFPAFDQAASAAEFAVQIISTLHTDSGGASRPETTALYREALDLLLREHSDSEAARYWRFFYAQLLEELGEFDAAAEQYALVDITHEHYVESAFATVRCLAYSLHEKSTDDTEDLILFRRRLSDFHSAVRQFSTAAADALHGEAPPERPGSIRAMRAEARVLSAEVSILSRLPQPAATLEALSTFEEEFPEQRDMAGRIWRIRLLAFDRLGQLDRAMEAIPRYVAADPERAGETLQALYRSLAAEADRRRLDGDVNAAQRKADMALVLAEQVHEWARDRGDPRIGGENAHALQLAEAYLRAGRFARAKELFQSLDEAPTGDDSGPSQLRLERGYAETQFQLGEYNAALPRFNRLAVELAPNDPLRWHALLRDLQCRTALAHAPADIIKVIQQQRYFHPELGGPRFAPQFERLERENRRRLDGE